MTLTLDSYDGLSLIHTLSHTHSCIRVYIQNMLFQAPLQALLTSHETTLSTVTMAASKYTCAIVRVVQSHGGHPRDKVSPEVRTLFGEDFELS